MENSSIISGLAQNGRDFVGAKLTLFFGTQIAVILRDDMAGLPYPGHWDLPGGGRENGETGWSCATRETQEELGITVPDSARLWARYYPTEQGGAWFFVAALPADHASRVRFGQEGQRWALWPPQEYIAHPKGIPHFQSRLSDALKEISL